MPSPRPRWPISGSRSTAGRTFSPTWRPCTRSSLREASEEIVEGGPDGRPVDVAVIGQGGEVADGDFVAFHRPAIGFGGQQHGLPPVHADMKGPFVTALGSELDLLH